jgi:hypothetical protein
MAFVEPGNQFLNRFRLIALRLVVGMENELRHAHRISGMGLRARSGGWSAGMANAANCNANAE